MDRPPTENAMEKLEQEEIQRMLEEFPEWSLNGETLQRTFRFKDFSRSMKFVRRIADLAEELGHYPDILIRSQKVTLTLTTSDVGGLTSMDFEFAQAADDRCVALS